MSNFGRKKKRRAGGPPKKNKTQKSKSKSKNKISHNAKKANHPPKPVAPPSPYLNWSKENIFFTKKTFSGGRKRRTRRKRRKTRQRGGELRQIKEFKGFSFSKWRDFYDLKGKSIRIFKAPIKKNANEIQSMNVDEDIVVNILGVLFDFNKWGLRGDPTPNQIILTVLNKNGKRFNIAIRPGEKTENIHSHSFITASDGTFINLELLKKRKVSDEFHLVGDEKRRKIKGGRRTRRKRRKKTRRRRTRKKCRR